tara:strand:+ start:81 stop:521 length:441 start_codon:yes stop_codon:yes gene_type:complete
MRIVIAAMIAIITAAAYSCGSTPPTPRNAELTVTYFGKEIKKEKPRWTNEARLREALKKPGKKYLVFGAEWCEACKFLRRALREGELNNAVENVNIDEPWVNSVASFYGINAVPTMLILGSDNTIIDIRSGPGPITIYLLLNIEIK